MNSIQLLHQLLAALSRHPFLERLLIASLELAVVTAVVVAIIHVARVRSNRVVSLLWLVALAKPVVSLLAGTPAPVWNAASLSPQVSTETVVVARPGVGNWGNGAPAVPAPPAFPVEAAPRTRIDAARTAKAVWLAGALLMVLLSVADRLRIRKLLAAATKPPPEIYAIYERAAAPLGGRRPPRLLITDRLESPAIVGTLYPVVLLPAWMTRKRDRDRVLWSLRHELSHWRHRDHFAGFVGEISRILFFFHPLVWWIGRKWKVAAEIACDQAMVATRGDARRYAEQLYQILARVHTRRQIMLVNGLFATRTQIGKRIELLLKSRPQVHAGRTVPAALFVLVFGVLVFSLGAELSPQADPGKIVLKTAGEGGHNVVTTIHDSDDGHDKFIKTRGKVKFNDDHTDVVSISPDGSFTVAEVRDGVERKLKIEPSRDGTLKYLYEVDDEERPFDDEARRWFREMLQDIDLDGNPKIIIGTRPTIRIKKPIVVDDMDDSHVTLRIVKGDEIVDIYRTSDDDETVDIMVKRDDDDGVWITTTTDVVNRTGDLVKFKIDRDGLIRITVMKDGDKHELETRAGDGDQTEYIYKLNGEVRPYDEKAKKIFDKYMNILEDGIELNVKGERI
jgi:beta-lactamase regulating signal transducer with metallopeptidase domain